jgi:hypothetical protein
MSMPIYGRAEEALPTWGDRYSRYSRPGSAPIYRLKATTPLINHKKFDELALVMC